MTQESSAIKMLSLKIFILAIFCVQDILCLRKVYCSPDDDVCLTNSLKERVMPKLTSGIPGIDSVDPVHLETIEVNLPTLNYTLYNATFSGLKNCDIYFRKSAESSFFEYRPCCRQVIIEGRYIADGKLDAVSVRGEGKVKIVYGNYNMSIIGTQEKVELKDCKQHYHITNYTLIAELVGKSAFEYENLVFGTTGKCKCSTALRNKYFERFEEITRTPIMEAFFKRIMEIVNDFHTAVPVENLYYKYV